MALCCLVQGNQHNTQSLVREGGTDLVLRSAKSLEHRDLALSAARTLAYILSTCPANDTIDDDGAAAAAEDGAAMDACVSGNITDMILLEDGLACVLGLCLNGLRDEAPDDHLLALRALYAVSRVERLQVELVTCTCDAKTTCDLLVAAEKQMTKMVYMYSRLGDSADEPTKRKLLKCREVKRLVFQSMWELAKSKRCHTFLAQAGVEELCKQRCEQANEECKGMAQQARAPHALPHPVRHMRRRAEVGPSRVLGWQRREHCHPFRAQRGGRPAPLVSPTGPRPTQPNELSVSRPLRLLRPFFAPCPLPHTADDAASEPRSGGLDDGRRATAAALVAFPGQVGLPGGGGGARLA